MDDNFDLDRIVKIAKDNAIISVYASAMSGEQREQFTKIMRTFTRRGIPAELVIEALIELSKNGVI